MVAPTPPLALDRLQQSGASPDWAQSPRGDPKLVPVDMLMKARRGAETLPERRLTTRAPSQFLDLAQSGEDIAAAARAGVVKRSKVSRSDRSIARRRSDPRERPTPRRPAQHPSTPPPRPGRPAQHHAPVGRARPPDPRAGAVEQARPRPPAGAADPPQAPGRRDERRRRRVTSLTNWRRRRPGAARRARGWGRRAGAPRRRPRGRSRGARGTWRRRGRPRAR